MTTSFFIVITGPPGAGKTTLARKLSKDLKFPLISKDTIKETLFDTLGWKDREWSKQLGLASVNILYSLLEENLEAKIPTLIETAFMPEFENERIGKLKKNYDMKTIQVYCWVDFTILWNRFLHRNSSGERHPGHVDHEAATEVNENIMYERYGVLDIGDYMLKVDLSDFDTVSYPTLLKEVESYIRKIKAV